MPGPSRLRGRRALVTGGGRGIGRAIALALARDGADVAVAARTRQQIERVAAEIAGAGRRSLAVAADVTRQSDVDRMAAQASEQLGPIDILVNAAGDAESAPLLKTDPAMWSRTIEVNLTAVFLCTRSLLAGMLDRGWGRIVTVASSAGLHGHAYVTAYCAAKHGVVGFTRAAALEVKGRGVTVNALCPGYVDTEMTRRSAERIAMKTGVTPEAALARLAGFNRSGRLLSPEEVARAAVDMAAPEAGARNGEAMEL